jgi:hypothetical protein
VFVCACGQDLEQAFLEQNLDHLKSKSKSISKKMGKIKGKRRQKGLLGSESLH